MRKIFIFFINIYQKTISPDHGFFKASYPYGYCRHYPSCSEYTKQAIEKHGSFMGILLGIKRIIKCNPWAQPSVDIIK